MAHAIRHDSVLHHRRYWPVAEGERAHRVSLELVFLGVPAAALGWQLWSHIVMGPGSRVQEVRFEGWGAVGVMLPATLLVVAVAVASVVLAAKSCAVHVHAARSAFWLSTAGLFLVLAVVATTSADDVQDGASAALEWAVRGVALVVAALVALVIRWWAREAGG